MYTDSDVARVVHEAQRAIQHVQGDPSPAEPWDAFPAERRAVVIDGVRRARNGESPRQLHESWCASMKAAGWKWGRVKDTQELFHPCLVPYDQLPDAQRDKDVLFCQIVLAMTILSAGDQASAGMDIAECGRPEPHDPHPWDSALGGWHCLGHSETRTGS